MKKLTAFLLAVLMVFSLCACGSASKSEAMTMDSSSANSAPAAMYDSAMMAASDEAYYGGFAAAEDGAAATGAAGGDVPQDDPQKIIYSADATVETTDFDGACAAVVKLMDKYGGWIESSSVSGANYYNRSRGSLYNRSASYQLRVPSAKFSTIMGELSTLGNVPYSHTYTDNVTAQYYDLDARLKAYQTQETRLLEMMEQAQTVTDIITIEDRLTELRYQIESIQSTLNSWDRQVSYSSIGLSLEEVQDYTPETAKSYGQELWQSLVGGLKNAAGFLKDLLVFLVGALPVLVVLALLALLVIFIVKKIVKARRQRKAKKALPTQPQADSEAEKK